MMRQLPEFREQVFSNGTYKAVALVASVILWLTILGRKDAVMIKDFNVEFLVKQHHIVVKHGDNRIKMKVKGPRMALKKFSQIDESIVINLNENGPGVYSVRIPKDGNLDLPFGVRVLSVEPQDMKVTIGPQKE